MTRILPPNPPPQPQPDRRRPAAETSTRRVETMLLFANGMFAAVDEHGQQIPELQVLSAVDLWIQHATAAGFDVRGCVVSVTKATGRIEETRDGMVMKWEKR